MNLLCPNSVTPSLSRFAQEVNPRGTEGTEVTQRFQIGHYPSLRDVQLFASHLRRESVWVVTFMPLVPAKLTP
jgi:hypothetical protein